MRIFSKWEKFRDCNHYGNLAWGYDSDQIRTTGVNRNGVVLHRIRIQSGVSIPVRLCSVIYPVCLQENSVQVLGMVPGVVHVYQSLGQSRLLFQLTCGNRVHLDPFQKNASFFDFHAPAYTCSCLMITSASSLYLFDVIYASGRRS